MSQQSNAGNPAELKEGELQLPNYLLRQADGIYVNLPLFPAAGGFNKFIDLLFNEGFRFVGVDYKLLLNLLYDYDLILETYGKEASVKLADDIVVFPANRKALYRGVKLDPEFMSAEYIFEPVQVEVDSEFIPTSLDVDEFIAEMWVKGIRFGIAIDEVASVISRRASLRMVIASALPAAGGNDAEIEEANDALRRDNTPKLLPNGKADLRRFQNCFPEIEKGTRLLRKKLGVQGNPGYRVDGSRIRGGIPKDVDLHTLAGTGTCVEMHGGDEYIVATRKGFLSIDVETNHIEITEKIENKAGISAKTTGDLSLAGKEFIEHGEVQEGRTVEGTNMTFRSDVFGNVISKGGFILLEKNMSNGSAKSLGGDVTVNGRAFNSIIEAQDGRVSLKYAEACTVLGQSVVIERAINCEIIAVSVEIGSAEGCGIAAKSVKIDSSNACRGKETNIAMVLPDLSVFEEQIRQIYSAIDSSEQLIQAKDQEALLISSEPEAAKYLALAESLKKSTVKLTAAHEENWKKMTAKFAKVDSALKLLNAEKQMLLKRVQAFQPEIAYLMEQREKSAQGIRCKIAEVAGDTLVRGMTVLNGIPALHKTKAGEIKLKLREQGSTEERVFFDDGGSLDWEYKPPEIDSAPA